jgi:hypothetical protein
MTVSRSYTMPVGQNYVESIELIYTDVYMVKRGGVQYDRYYTGDPNRRYIYAPAQGRIYFDISAPIDEKIFVLFKRTFADPPFCVPVAVSDSTMPDAVVNVSYSKSFPLSGTPPFELIVINKPSWADVEVSLGGVVTVMGFPDVAGPETLEFEVTNCGPTVAISKMFTTIANTENIFFVSGSFSRITGVTGIPFTVTTGSFPVYLSNTASGIHNDYTGDISVTVSTIIFPRTLRLYKNEVLMESIAVTANGTYTFSSASYLESDVIKIYL